MPSGKVSREAHGVHRTIFARYSGPAKLSHHPAAGSPGSRTDRDNRRNRNPHGCPPSRFLLGEKALFPQQHPGLPGNGLSPESAKHSARGNQLNCQNATCNSLRRRFYPGPERDGLRSLRVAFDSYADDLRGKLGIAEDEHMILQPTRIVQRKGIEHAIELVSRLERAAKLVISHSSGDESDDYATRIRDYARHLNVELVFAAEIIGEDRCTSASAKNCTASATSTAARTWSPTPQPTKASETPSSKLPSTSAR